MSTKHVIDCDKFPYLPRDWMLVEHTPGGKVIWNPDEVELWLCDRQQKKKPINGNELRKLIRVMEMPPLNARVLDYLLEHPDLIPEEWKGKVVFFWGNIYWDSDDRPCVRCLFWDGLVWHGDSYLLDSLWLDFSPAALSCK